MNIKAIAQETLTEKFNFGKEPTDHLAEEIETIITIAVDIAMVNADMERERLLSGTTDKNKRKEKAEQNIHIKPRHIPRISDILKVHIND